MSLDHLSRTTWSGPPWRLKKLVADRVEVSERRPAKRVRSQLRPARQVPGDRVQIACARPRKSGKWPAIGRRSSIFGNLAEEYSVEPSSRALRGEVPPIQKPTAASRCLEKEAFALQAGELSERASRWASKYVILFCEGFTKPIGDAPSKKSATRSTKTSRKEAAAGHGQGVQPTSRRARRSTISWPARRNRPIRAKSASDWTPGQSISQPDGPRSQHPSHAAPGIRRGRLP